MRIFALALSLVLVSSGCTHRQLQRSTLNQTGTLNDVQYRMVLDNVALLTANPGVMPQFALLSTGQIQITDAGSTTDAVIPNAASPGIVSGNYNVMGSRNIQQNWNIQPIQDPDKLKRMRCAYSLALGQPLTGCEDCYKDLASFLCPDQCVWKKGKDAEALVSPEDCSKCLQCVVPQGWFCTGGKRDVPRDACYVGRHGDTYAWVLPSGLEGLTRFTLSVLDIATVTSHATTAQVKWIYARDPSGELKLIGAEATTTETTPIDQKKDPFASRSSAPKLRIQPFLLSPNVPAVPSAGR